MPSLSGLLPSPSGVNRGESPSTCGHYGGGGGGGGDPKSRTLSPSHHTPYASDHSTAAEDSQQQVSLPFALNYISKLKLKKFRFASSGENLIEEN